MLMSDVGDKAANAEARSTLCDEEPVRVQEIDAICTEREREIGTMNKLYSIEATVTKATNLN